MANFNIDEDYDEIFDRIREVFVDFKFLRIPYTNERGLFFGTDFVHINHKIDINLFTILSPLREGVDICIITVTIGSGIELTYETLQAINAYNTNSTGMKLFIKEDEDYDLPQLILERESISVGDDVIRLMRSMLDELTFLEEDTGPYWLPILEKVQNETDDY